jgi:hypothetical protein
LNSPSNKKKLTRVFGLHFLYYTTIIHAQKPIPTRVSLHHHLATLVGFGRGKRRCEGEEEAEEDGGEEEEGGCPEAGFCAGNHGESRSSSPGVSKGGLLVDER